MTTLTTTAVLGRGPPWQTGAQQKATAVQTDARDPGQRQGSSNTVSSSARDKVFRMYAIWKAGSGQKAEAPLLTDSRTQAVNKLPIAPSNKRAKPGSGLPPIDGDNDEGSKSDSDGDSDSDHPLNKKTPSGTQKVGKTRGFACFLYKNNPLAYGGENGCSVWTSINIETLCRASIHLSEIRTRITPDCCFD